MVLVAGLFSTSALARSQGSFGGLTGPAKEIANAFNALIDDSLADPDKLSQSVGLKYKTELHVKAYVDKLKHNMSTRDALFGTTQAQTTTEPTTQGPTQAPSLVPRPPLLPGAAYTAHMMPVSSHGVYPHGAWPGQPQPFLNPQQPNATQYAMAYQSFPWGMQPPPPPAGRVCRKCTAAHGYEVYFKDPRCNCMSEAVKAAKAAKRHRSDSS